MAILVLEIVVAEEVVARATAPTTPSKVVKEVANTKVDTLPISSAKFV